MTREIPLTRGLFALVDDLDYERVNAFKWCAVFPSRTRCYAQRRRTNEEGGGIEYLHRFLLDAPANMLVDHENGYGLDCRRQNLRLCDATGNARNRRATGRLKGVYLDKRRGHWIARVKAGDINHWIGSFKTDIEAAEAYDRVAATLHGAFARLNFPHDDDVPPLGKEDGRWTKNQIGAALTP